MKNYFLVTTYGRTASHWLTQALNKHKDISCSHGPFGGNVGPNYEDGSERSLDQIRKEAVKIWNKMSIDEMFSRMEERKSLYYGNIHGYNWSSINARFLNEDIKRKIKIANITRHPINRIVSLVAAWEKEESVSIITTNFYENEFKRFFPIANKYLEGTYVNFEEKKNRRLFLAAYITLYYDAIDLFIDGLHIPMERLTKDPEIFLLLLKYLTNSDLDIDKDFFRSVYSLKRISYTSSEISTSLDNFVSLPDWTKSFLSNLLVHFDRFYSLGKKYKNLGYEISMISSGTIKKQEKINTKVSRQVDYINTMRFVASGRSIVESSIISAIKTFFKFGYNENEEIILYGSGRHTEIFISEYIEKYKNISKLIVVCPLAKTNEIFGVRVIPVESFDLHSANKILISSYNYEDEIFHRLISLGVQSDRIIRLHG